MDKLLKVVAEQNEEAESSFQLKRIADAMEEILRLVKKDQEDSAARQRPMDRDWETIYPYLSPLLVNLYCTT